MSQQYFLYSLAIFIPMNATSIPTPTIHPPQTSILISQYIIPAMTGLDIPSLICAMFFPVSTTQPAMVCVKVSIVSKNTTQSEINEKEQLIRNTISAETSMLHTLSEEAPEDYNEISFVCLRPDGCLELPSTLGIVCRSVSNRLDGFEGFHFHQLRHTYTSNLLSNGAAPKDIQELLGHSDVSTTMNVYAHSTRKAKRNSARLLDKVAGND